MSRAMSIAELACELDKARSEDSYRIAFSNWLDSVYADTTSKDLFTKEPQWGNLSKEKVAYLAATAHFLSNKRGIPAPEWCFKMEYSLESPDFAIDSDGELKYVLLCQSPREFRARNIFLSKNALSRA